MKRKPKTDKKPGYETFRINTAFVPLVELRRPHRRRLFVVPGNHDHWFDWPVLRRELNEYGIRVLSNDAAQFGPLAVGGLDDEAVVVGAEGDALQAKLLGADRF